MADNPMIKQITLPSGTTYDIKDEWARERINALGNYSYFMGVTTTVISDGDTTNPVTINSQSVTAETGGIVTYGSAEFIWNGSAWQAFGDLSGLGDMAFADTASGSYTPVGSVSKPTFTGTEATISVSGTPSGTVSKPAFTGTQGSVSVSGTPSGTVSKPTFTGTQGSVSVTGTPSGTVSQPTFSGTSGSVNVAGTPSGEVTTNIFDGVEESLVNWPGKLNGTLANTRINPTTGAIESYSGYNVYWIKVGESSYYSVSHNASYFGWTNETPASGVVVNDVTPSGNSIRIIVTPGSTSLVVSASSGTQLSYIEVKTGAKRNYRPTGTVSQPTTTVELNTTTVNSIDNVGTLPSCTLPTLQTSVANEVLTLSWTAGSFSAGTLPTKGVDTTVATSVQSASTTQPTFSGTWVCVDGIFEGESMSSTGSFTPAGTVSQPTFSGSSMTSTGNFTPTGSVSQPTFSGSSLTSTGNFTPAGTVSQPTFSGSSLTSTGTYTPAGSVSKPSFTGTAGTVTVEPDSQS